MANNVDPDQTAPIGAVCSGSTLFASILNSSVVLGNHLQQTTSADDIFRCIFFLALSGLENFLGTYSSCGASGLNFSLVLTPVELVLKAAKSVTFDLLILDLMFLFFKNTVKKLKFSYTFYQFRKS